MVAGRNFEAVNFGLALLLRSVHIRGCRMRGPVLPLADVYPCTPSGFYSPSLAAGHAVYVGVGLGVVKEPPELAYMFALAK